MCKRVHSYVLIVICVPNDVPFQQDGVYSLALKAVGQLCLS